MEAVDLEGIYTHFANADEPDPSYTYEQIVHFRALLRALGSAGHAFGVRHAANSAATLDFTESHLDLVRVGIGLFGGGPPCTVASAPDLQQAVALRARVARLVELEKGEGVGYGHTWRAEVPSRIAVVSAGYADGVSRQLSNRGCALINGCETPIVGRVSMDFTTLDVTAVPGVGTDSVVTFFGTSSGRTLRLARFAGDAGTIAHDALSSVGGRVPRVYLRHGGITRILRLSGSTTL
jgi:alanine racemase